MHICMYKRKSSSADARIGKGAVVEETKDPEGQSLRILTNYANILTLVHVCKV